MDELEALLARDYWIHGRRSIERIRYAFRHLRRLFHAGFPLEIARAASARYAELRMREGAAAATAANELRLLARALRVAHECQLIPALPRLTIPTVRNVRQGFFDAAELRAVLPHLRPPVRAAVRFAYITGWRRGEILGLRWEAVDLDEGMIRLEPGTTKNDRARAYPFAAHPDLEALIVERLALRQGPFVFHHRGRRYRDIWHQFKRACRLAGIEGRTVHDLRRSCVRNLERAGVPRRIAMQLTGHRTESVYARYDIVNEGDLATGVRRLAEYQDGKGR